MIRIDSDWSAIDKEIDRVASLPNVKTTALLDAVLAQGFAQTLANTHVITGSLKASEKMSSHAGKDSWKGTITAGGPSTGINNPVNYAIYEKRRRGDHDFFGNLHLLNSLYIKALLKGLKK